MFSSGFSYLFVIKRCPTGQIFDEKKQKCVKNTSEEPGCAKQVSKDKPRTSRLKPIKRKNETHRQQQQLKLPSRPSAVKLFKRKNFEQERTEPDEQIETTLATTQFDEPGQEHWQRVCYVTNWSRYRAGEAKFEIEYIDPFMCSHIVYAYATVDDNKPEIIPVQKEDIGNEQRRRFIHSLLFDLFQNIIENWRSWKKPIQRWRFRFDWEEKVLFTPAIWKSPSRPVNSCEVLSGMSLWISWEGLNKRVQVLGYIWIRWRGHRIRIPRSWSARRSPGCDHIPRSQLISAMMNRNVNDRCSSRKSPNRNDWCPVLLLPWRSRRSSSIYLKSMTWRRSKSKPCRPSKS